ncbi:hypothetical protein MHYP_G00242410 [Metynnis hypsauchen]
MFGCESRPQESSSCTSQEISCLLSGIIPILGFRDQGVSDDRWKRGSERLPELKAGQHHPISWQMDARQSGKGSVTGVQSKDTLKRPG